MTEPSGLASVLASRLHFAFGITEPGHGSDATFMETRFIRPDSLKGVTSPQA